MTYEQLACIQRNHYQDVVDERSAALRCGYPLCTAIINDEGAIGKYRIDFTTRKIYDTTNLKKFCSEQCCEASMHVLNQISEVPLAARTIPTPIVREIAKEDLLFTTNSPEVTPIVAMTSELQEHQPPYRFLPSASDSEMIQQNSSGVAVVTETCTLSRVPVAGDLSQCDELSVSTQLVPSAMQTFLSMCATFCTNVPSLLGAPIGMVVSLQLTTRYVTVVPTISLSACATGA